MRMALAALVALCLGTAAAAQKGLAPENPAINKAYPLSKLDQWVKVDKKCGEYMGVMFLADRVTGAKAAHLLIRYPFPFHGNPGEYSATLAGDQIKGVRLVKGLKVPTATLWDRNEFGDIYVLNLSPEEYEKADCLSKISIIV
jgi:hypothetical protein